MSNSKPYIFISSTISNLQEERKILKDIIINKYGFSVFLSEEHGADSFSPYSVCIDELKKSDIVICV